MSNTENGQSRERKEGDFDTIERCFYLEQTPLSCESESAEHQSTQSSVEDNTTDADILVFTPITGRKEDPYAKQLAEALKHENHSGGRGPFVFPHSPDTFMGYPDKVPKQPVEVERAEVMPPRPLTNYYTQNRGPAAYANPNLFYGPQQFAGIGAIAPRPVVYNYNPSWAYNFQPQNYGYIPYSLAYH